MAKSDPLPEKYLKALALLKEGNLSYRDVAKACSINESNFYDLLEGTADNLGTIQERFTKAYQEIQKQQDKEILNLVKKNKKAAQLLVDRYLCEVGKEKKIDRRILAVVGVVNALAKSTPGVHIGSFSYTKGLSAEDIANEWKRLKGIANDRGVQSLTERGTGASSVGSGTGSPASEEPEDPIL